VLIIDYRKRTESGLGAAIPYDGTPRVSVVAAADRQSHGAEGGVVHLVVVVGEVRDCVMDGGGLAHLHVLAAGHANLVQDVARGVLDVEQPEPPSLSKQTSSRGHLRSSSLTSPAAPWTRLSQPSSGIAP
jgi:hypothetical protein